MHDNILKIPKCSSHTDEMPWQGVFPYSATCGFRQLWSVRTLCMRRGSAFTLTWNLRVSSYQLLHHTKQMDHVIVRAVQYVAYQGDMQSEHLECVDAVRAATCIASALNNHAIWTFHLSTLNQYECIMPALSTDILMLLSSYQYQPLWDVEATLVIHNRIWTLPAGREATSTNHTVDFHNFASSPQRTMQQASHESAHAKYTSCKMRPKG